MTHWVLLVAPLVLASFVMLFAFVGCLLDSSGLGGPAATYASDVSDHPSAVSYWRLGEATPATTAEDSKGGNDGTYVGTVTLGQTGLVVNDTNTAALFDGSTGYVSVPRLDDSLNPPKFTVEALVDLQGGADQVRAVVSSRDVGKNGELFGFILLATAENKWEAWVGDGAAWQVASGPDVTNGIHYLAVTYDGTTLNLYVDPGEATAPASATAPGYIPNTANELRIGAGANEGDPQFFFNGVIDDVAVYNDALEDATVRAHFSRARTV